LYTVFAVSAGVSDRILSGQILHRKILSLWCNEKFCELGLNCVGFGIHESTDIAAIKSDLEQLSQVKTNTKTLLDNQQSLLELLQSNLTAMNRIGELYLNSVFRR